MAKRESAGDGSGLTILEGVTLSRTLPPRQPANFISRAALVDSIDTRAPGTTLIVGPVGYGKTSLATEIAQRHEGYTFWYTMVDEDTAEKFNAHVIQSVRNVIPGFAPWFQTHLKFDPTDLIVKFSNELLTHKGEYIFIVDNRRSTKAINFAIANQMLRSLPTNLHLIQVRRKKPEALAVDLAPTGNLQTVGPNELKFTTAEMATMIALNGLSDQSNEVLHILESVQGWPAAVQLIIRGIAKGVDFQTTAERIISSSNPLHLIVEEFVRSLSSSNKKILEPLSIVNKFSPELAQSILGNDYSQSKIEAFAFDGVVLSKSGSAIPAYKMHSLVRDYLYKELSSNEEKFVKYHHLASRYFESQLDATQALEHAFLAKDLIRFEKLFRAGARIFAISGRGDELLRWAKYAGDESTEGQVKRQTVAIAGHLANLDLERVEALNATMRLQAQGTELEQFIERFSALIQVATDFSIGQFENLEVNAEKAAQEDEFAGDVDFTDALFALRRLAGYYFLLDDVEKIEAVDKRAKELLDRKFSTLGHVHQLAVRALCAYQQGSYQDAFESSRMALSLSDSLEMASYQGPYDIKYILARCHYEFTDLETAYEIFNEISESSIKGKQWVWYSAVIAFVSVTLAQRGDSSGATEALRTGREKVSSIHSKNQLQSILDRADLVMQLINNDLEKMKLIIKTALPGRTTQLIALYILRAEGKDWDPSKKRRIT